MTMAQHARCVCDCHSGAAPESVADRRRADGVSLFDPVEAAIACSKCRALHSVALLNRLDASAPIVDPDAWIDPPFTNGGGDE